VRASKRGVRIALDYPACDAGDEAVGAEFGSRQLRFTSTSLRCGSDWGRRAESHTRASLAWARQVRSHLAKERLTSAARATRR